MIDGLPLIGGQDGHAPVVLHALQQVVDLDVGVAVVAVPDLAAASEERVGLVEEQQGAALVGGVEHLAQVAFSLADVFADHAGQVDPVQGQPEFTGDDLGGQGLAGAGLASEQGSDAAAPGDGFGEAPVAQHGGPALHLVGEVAQQHGLLVRQNEIVPAGDLYLKLGERLKARTGLRLADVPQAVGAAATGAGALGLLADGRLVEIELPGQPPGDGIQAAVPLGDVGQYVAPQFLLLHGTLAPGVDQAKRPSRHGHGLAAADEDRTTQVPEQTVQGSGFLGRRVAHVDVQGERQQQRLAFPQPDDVGEVEAGAGQPVGGQLVEQEASPLRDCSRPALPGGGGGSQDFDERHLGRRPRPGPEPVEDGSVLAGFQRAEDVADWADQVIQA